MSKISMGMSMRYFDGVFEWYIAEEYGPMADGKISCAATAFTSLIFHAITVSIYRG